MSTNPISKGKSKLDKVNEYLLEVIKENANGDEKEVRILTRTTLKQAEVSRKSQKPSARPRKSQRGDRRRTKGKPRTQAAWQTKETLNTKK
jgi:hypothetical protein